MVSELERRGHPVVKEPGRRIIANELKGAGKALPWLDLVAFSKQAVEMSLNDREKAKNLKKFVFFDRGLIDAAVALEHATGKPALSKYATHRYNQCVFVTPPWTEIYVQDAARQHGFNEAVAEYERLLAAFDALKYHVEVLPKIDVVTRADIILASLNSP